MRVQNAMNVRPTKTSPSGEIRRFFCFIYRFQSSSSEFFWDRKVILCPGLQSDTLPRKSSTPEYVNTLQPELCFDDHQRTITQRGPIERYLAKGAVRTFFLLTRRGRLFGALIFAVAFNVSLPFTRAPLPPLMHIYRVSFASGKRKARGHLSFFPSTERDQWTGRDRGF